MTKLEIYYPEFEDFNLSRETLEGTVKHNGPITKITGSYLIAKKLLKNYLLPTPGFRLIFGMFVKGL